MRRLAIVQPVLFAMWVGGLGLWGCGEQASQDDSPVVAEVGNFRLTQRMLIDRLPESLRAAADSAVWANQYVSRWLEQASLAQRATEELRTAQQDIQPALEEYKQALLAQQYREWLIREQLDTTVSAEELRQYYNEHPEQYRTNTPLVQFYYVKTDDPQSTPQLRTRMASSDPEDWRIIRAWAAEKASDKKLDDSYQEYATLMGYQPEFPTFNLAQMPAGSPVLVSAAIDENGERIVSFLYIRDITPAGSQMPLEAVEPQIRALLLNRRRAQLINTLEQDILDDAIQRKVAQRYDTDA